jgi:hypothetical protein
MNYLKQPNWYSCAPTALLNAFILLGYKVNKKQKYKELCLLLKLKKNYGTTQSRFHKALKYLFPNSKKIKQPTLEDLNEPCILTVDNSYWCHVGIVLKSTKHYLYLVNWGTKYPLIRKVKKDTFKKELNRRAVAYILKK